MKAVWRRRSAAWLLPLVALTLLLAFDSQVVFGQKVVSLPDYFPTDASVYGTRTLRWTFGKTGEFTSEIIGSVTVPYKTGAITGARYTGEWTDGASQGVGNDGATVRWALSFDSAEGGRIYGSTDCELTDYPLGWTFTTARSGTVAELGPLYAVSEDLKQCELAQHEETVLWLIQDIRVSAGFYQDAIVCWSLDNDRPYVNLDFQGWQNTLGLIPPTSEQTHGYLVKRFLIFGRAACVIAGGEIEQETGKLQSVYELASVAYPALPPSSPLPLASAFSQMALGGGYESVVILSNKTNQPWDGSIRLLEGSQQNWSHAWTLNGVAQTGTSQFAVSLPARATQRHVLGGDSQARAGYLMIDSTTGGFDSIAASLYYTYSQQGQLIDSLGISASRKAERFWFSAEKTAVANTGFAFAPAVAGEPFDVKLTLFSNSGAQLQTQTMVCSGHVARFFAGPDGVFQNVPDGFIGAVLVESPQSLLLTVLRMDLIAAGVQLTALSPVTEGITASSQ
jgi:hypothetical protein